MLTMEECIKETPQYLLSLLKWKETLFKELKHQTFTRVILSGSGSSYHAAMSAKEFMQEKMKIPVEVLYPFQVATYHYNNPNTTLFIGISQSGTSLSACRAMKHAKEHGCVCASMAGREDDATILNEHADYILTVHCGEEGDLQPKTKGMICTIANLMLFALDWALAHACITKEQYMDIQKEYIGVANHMNAIVDDAERWIKKHGRMLADAVDIRLIGTHDIYGITLEGSLKLVETLRVPVSGYEFEEFTHGIYNAVNDNSVIILLDTGVENRMETLKHVLSRWSKYVLISGVHAKDEYDFFVSSIGTKHFVSFEYILWIFMICEKVSAMKGIDIQTTKDVNFHALLGSKILRKED